MTKQDVLRTGSMLAQEVLSALHLPGSVALSRSVELALKKRFDEGVAALIDELAAGTKEGIEFGKSDHDEFVQMLLRFHDAMKKGTAVRNLRLLGRLIVGIKADGSFHYDEFNKLAGALEGLNLDDLELLAKIYRLGLKYNNDNDLWNALRDRPANDGYIDRNLTAQLNALTRTGFIVSLSGWGTLVYLPAPTLMRLGKLARWYENISPFEKDG